MTAPRRLRVVTYNIHGGRPANGPPDLPAVAEVLRALDPDVVGLQEVYRWLPTRGGLQDQPRRLARMLGLELVFVPTLHAGPCAYGHALLTRRPARQVRRVRLPATGTLAAVRHTLRSTAGWPVPDRCRRLCDAMEPRSLLAAWLEVEGRAVRVLNTHLCLYEDERLAQARAFAAEVRTEEGPTLALGDWNGTPAAPEIVEITAAGLAHCVDPGVSTFPAESPTARIDYIAASPHFRVLEGWTVQTAASDHLPLAAHLLLE